MKTLFLTLALTLLFESIGFGAVVERVIHSGDTPLFSDCKVTQTGPMELTVAPCTFTTTGEAKVFGVAESLPAMVGIGPLANALREGKAEWMSGSLRVRAWLRNGQGNIIERSRTRFLPVAAVTVVPAGNVYFLYLIEKPGPTLGVVLMSTSSPRPLNYIHILAFDFTVPVGTTDLSGIEIEVFTVKPGFPPSKGLFQK